MFTNRYFLGSLAFSLVLHLGFLGLVKFYRKPVREIQFEEIREVSFYDPSQRPEVAAAVGGGGPASSPARGSGGGGGGGGGSGGGVAYMPAIPGYKDLTDDQVAPLSAVAKMAGTQARVNADRYAFDDGSGLDVIRLADKSSGRTQTTEEILAAQPLALARGVAGSGGGGGSGYSPYGGAANIPRVQDELVTAPQPAISQADMNKRIDRAKKEIVQEQTRPEQERVVVAPSTKPTVTIAGEISQRGRVRCGLPRYPEWAIKQGASGTVVVRVYVAPDGAVRENLTVESTSGYPGLDELVVNMLRNWQFAPLPTGAPQVDQWGRITVRFVLG